MAPGPRRPFSCSAAGPTILAALFLLVALGGASGPTAADEPVSSLCAAGRTLSVAGRTYVQTAVQEGIQAAREVVSAAGAGSLCMGCHDGTVAEGVPTGHGPSGRDPRRPTTPGFLVAKLPSAGAGLGSMPGSNHPVGMPYPERDRDFVPRHRLDPRLRLEGGLVGCSTCHGDPETPGALSIPNRGSALCLACHRK